MFTSFSTALSALNATSTAIDVVGNNLANMNTPGFKTSEVCFLDLVTESLGAGLGTTQVGFGTAQPLTVREFTQGAIQTSAGLMDAAIQGTGFFVTTNSSGNTLYTRAGNFTDGQLRQPDHRYRPVRARLDHHRPDHRAGGYQWADRQHRGPRRHLETASRHHGLHRRPQPELLGGREFHLRLHHAGDGLRQPGD